MSLTVTAVKAPEFIAPGIKRATYAVEFDDSYVTGGEPWDLSADFDHVSGMTHGAGKDIAQTTHWCCIFGTLVAGKGIAAADVLLGVVVSATGVQAASTFDLSGIDELIITIEGS